MDFETTFPLQFYINLNRRDDRRRTVLNGFLDHGLERVERFPAIDSRRILNARGRWSSGRYALALTQKLCLREARRRRAPAVMLFEDDVVLHPEFQERFAALELPEDWGIFYLGVQHTEEPEWVAPGLVKVGFGLDTHAVAVRAEYYERVMQVLSPQGKAGRESIKPSDWLLAALHQEIPTYAAFPNLAWQGQEAVSDLMGRRNGTYDARGFQHSNGKIMYPVLRRHLGLPHWREVVPEESAESEVAAGGPGSDVKSPRKVAFLFLTRRVPHQVEMWSEYFADHEAEVSICVHAKDDSGEGPEWWQQAKRAVPVETAWGKVSLVQAHRHLLEKAMEDPANGAFVLVSESCVPIKPLASLLAHLERTGWRGQLETERHEDMATKHPQKAKRLEAVKDVPPSFWRFHPQWMLLNREMAQAVLAVDLTPAWEQSFAPDESLIGTQLVLMGYPLEERALPSGSTWTRWEGPRAGHPQAFGDVNESLLMELLASPHFFARKFTEESNIRESGLHLPGAIRLPDPGRRQPASPHVLDSGHFPIPGVK